MVDIFGQEPIRALSWKEPYLSLMLHGKTETRTWNTNYRGLVLMCGSLAPYPFEVVNNKISGSHQTNRIWETLDYDSNFKTKYCGKAAAIGRLVDCRPMTKADEDKCFVQYKEPWFEMKSNKNKITGIIKITNKQKKLFCHIYEDVREIKPFDWKGSQGWGKVDQKIIDTLEFFGT